MCHPCQRYGTLSFLAGTPGMCVKNSAIWMCDSLSSGCILRNSLGIWDGSFSSCDHLALQDPD